MRSVLIKATSTAMLAAALSPITFAQAEKLLSPSPVWAQAMPAAPVAGTRMTAEYVKQIGRMAYFWAWPMMNLQNRLETFRR